MAYSSPPPLQIPVSQENAARKQEVALPWADFFNNMWAGDSGEAWTPNFTGLTVVAPVTITGTFARISNSLVFFSILLDPTGGGSVSATAGTTYAEGFPLQFLRDTGCLGVSGGLGGLPGHVVAGTNRIYIPAISGATVPVTICGIGFAS